MGYIHKNRTFVLIGIIIMVSLSYAGSTVFYKQSFEKVNRVVEEKEDKISELANSLLKTQKDLDTTRIQLKDKQEREEDLSNQYLDVKGEKETLEGEKVNLEENLDKAEDSLKEIEEELEDNEKIIILLNANIVDLELDKDSLESELENITDISDDYLDDLESICDDNDVEVLNITKCQDYE